MTDRILGTKYRPVAASTGDHDERHARQVDLIQVARASVARNAPRTTIAKEQGAATMRVQIERTRSSAKDTPGS